MNEQIIAALTTGKEYNVEYTNGSGESKTVDGTLISLDECGFVVLDVQGGKRILIRKDAIDRMTEK
jgi:hypothetical protein